MTQTDYTTDRNTIDASLVKIADIIKATNVRDDGLLNGGLGSALYFLYLSDYCNNHTYQSIGEKRVEDILKRAFSGSSTILRKNSLLSGIVGLAWTIQELAKERLIAEDYTKFLPSADKIIFERIPSQIKMNSLDYVHSSAGALAYLAERGSVSSQALDYLELLVKELENKVSTWEGKGTFIRNQYYYHKTGIGHQHEVNLRLAHGYSGILLILIKIYKLGVAQESIQTIIEGGIAFILSTAQLEHFDDTTSYIFPSYLRTSLPKNHPTNLNFYKVRMGWCYGDLNQVLLLYQAGHLLNRQDWINIADRVGAFTLRKKSYEETKISDTCLCHGTSGVGQFYRAIYEASRHEQYLDGYTYWMQKTVQWTEETLDSCAWPIKLYSFLEGFAGSGLALIDYSSERHSAWNKFLLL